MKGDFVDQDEMVLQLLQIELGSLQQAIRGLDTIVAQIKGWSVTVAVAIGGVALATKHPALLWLGVACTAGFFLLTCQSKRHQRVFISRNKRIHKAIRDDGIRAVIEGKSSVTVTGAPILEGANHGLRGYLFEASLPNVWLIYLLTIGSLALEALLLR
jgi:hypothetical protein